MKSIALTLLVSLSYTVWACDVCSSHTSSGLELNGQSPNSLIGVRHIYKYFKVANPLEDTRTIHMQYLDVHATYKAHQRVAVHASLPYIWQNKVSIDREKQVSGLGDMYLGLSVTLLDRPSRKEDSRWAHRLYGGAGLEMPTGKYILSSSEGSASQSVVSGSDSWDPSFQLQYQALHTDWYIYAGSSIKINTENKREYKLGNIYSALLMGGYSNIVRKSVYVVSAGIKSDVYGLNTNYGIGQRYSGGQELSLLYGMQWTVWNLRFNTALQHPLYQNLSDGTLKSPLTVQASIDYIF